VSEQIELNGLGVRLYAVRLYNHDFLWFSSFEISKRASTAPLIHNFALSYAVSGYTYGIYGEGRPRYAEDLRAMPAYATPALPEGVVRWTQFTQNAINSVTLRTEGPKGINSPALGWRVVLDPVWQGTGGFRFYVFTRGGFEGPRVMRLGKKGCPVRLEWDEIPEPVAVFTDRVTRPTHAVNPLDVQGEIVAYEPVAIPPHLILRVADIERDWFVFREKHRIHIPRRFTDAGWELPGVSAEAETRMERSRRGGKGSGA